MAVHAHPCAHCISASMHVNANNNVGRALPDRMQPKYLANGGQCPPYKKFILLFLFAHQVYLRKKNIYDKVSRHMQTQCPHCDTRFRVTEAQVNTADGFVRCSVCEEVFNAIEVAEQDDYQQSLLSQAYSDNEPPVEQTTDTDIKDDTDTEVTDNELDLSDLENIHFEQAEDNTYENNTTEDIDDLNTIETVDFNETSATDYSRKDAFDFFDEEDNESLSHVVPEKYKDSYTSDSTNLVSNLLWGAGTLLLTATLLIEYAWFNRDQLNQMPQLQAWTEKLCQQFECKNIAMRNPAKIELVSRNVYSHPNEKNALMINITMKNQANFAQPYPIMQINFSDVRGGNIAARRFRPTEYLPAEIQQQASQQLFEPDTNMTFTMEIQDPGKQAMTYEFDFL